MKTNFLLFLLFSTHISSFIFSAGKKPDIVLTADQRLFIATYLKSNGHGPYFKIVNIRNLSFNHLYAYSIDKKGKKGEMFFVGHIASKHK